VFIVQEVIKQGKLDTEFAEVKDKIRLYWSLMQIEKACTDPSVINENNLKFINDVEYAKLDSRHFLLFKQLICLVKMWFDQ
jgi:hypothetical protein